ncbi:MAG: HD domain-containing protein [Candidatus Improbicoccus devescovinae]|nr:MAG: HD domain-containing protein [Candidatus Improbicoccus devescovinae]
MFKLIYKEKFIEIYKKYITRAGSSQFLSWLESTDFFSAPASAKFHCAKEGGLVEHSVNVYNTMRSRYFDESENEESFAICGLLHDICKVNFYKIATRNVKNENTGVWEKQPFYSIDDIFPYGHGEKSVFLIERFVRLSVVEAMAIRWHMAGFDDSVKSNSFIIGLAFNKCSLAVKLALSDLESTYLVENTQLKTK